MRFGDHLQVREEIEAAAMDCLVPSLLLQPLVRTPSATASNLPGDLVNSASPLAKRKGLRLTVEDNGVGLAPDSRAVRALDWLMSASDWWPTAGRRSSKIAERPEGGVVVGIRLPARTEVASPI
jgi:LytS/YehU family sensor histidine kinase